MLWVGGLVFGKRNLMFSWFLFDFIMIRRRGLLYAVIYLYPFRFAYTKTSPNSTYSLFLVIINRPWADMLSFRHLRDGCINTYLHFLREVVNEKAGGAL
jgi:hypothetical protein